MSCVREAQMGLLRLLKMVNVEPVLFIFAVQLGIQATIVQPFLYWRRCTQVYSDLVEDLETFCSNQSLHNSSSPLEERVQADVSQYMVYMSLAITLPTVILGPILSAWSDSTGGRKPPMLIAMACTVLAHVPFILCTVLLWVSYYWILLGFAVGSLGGGVVTVFSATFSSINDQMRSSEEGRKQLSIRIGVASGTFSIGMVLGSVVATLFRMEDYASYLWPFVVGQACVVVGYFYTILCVRETHKVDEENATTTTTIEDPCFCDSCMALFGTVWKRLKEAVQVVIEPRKGRKRAGLLLGLLLYFIQMSANMGAGTLLLLFVKRAPFHWDDVQYGFFLIYINGIAGLGMITCPIVVDKIGALNVKSKDTVVIIFGIACSSIYYCLLSFSKSAAMLYSAGALMLFANVFSPGFRSVFSKLVEINETARIMAAMALLESFCPLVAALLFNNVYTLTETFWPGFSFLLSALIQVPVGVAVWFLHKFAWRLKESEATDSLVDQEITTDEGISSIFDSAN